MPRLNDKVAIITGAASGIGLATAELFSVEGAHVVATDISEDALSAAAEKLAATGGDVIAQVLDVSSAESWKRVTDAVLAQWGTIDILINNAGIATSQGILEVDLRMWNKILEINTTGTMLGMKSVIPAMREAGQGSIVNVSSLAALISGDADGGGAAYSASKGAVRSLTKHAAYRFAPDRIRVNSVHPGPIYTPLVQRHGLTKQQAANPDNVVLPPHIGEPSDIGYGILYLASDEAKFVTGEELVIDGGYAAH